MPLFRPEHSHFFPLPPSVNLHDDTITTSVHRLGTQNSLDEKFSNSCCERIQTKTRTDEHRRKHQQKGPGLRPSKVPPGKRGEKVRKGGQMSALSKSRTWSTNRHGQEASARRRSSTATSISTAEHKTSSTSTNTSTRVTTLTANAAAAGCGTAQQQQQQLELQQHEYGDQVAHPSFLQPRVAALLGVSKWWHPILFGLRLLSILPSIYLGFPLFIRFLLKLHAFATSESAQSQGRTLGEDRLLLTETLLAILWCGCSGYLSFFFTDCLMSRW